MTSFTLGTSSQSRVNRSLWPRVLSSFSLHTIDLDNIAQACRHGIWVELITNLIPGINDSEEEFKAMAEWIRTDLGSEIPWHLTRFFPAFHFSNHAPTPVDRMEELYALAKKSGLKFVYLGNLPGHSAENTCCPDCGILLIERRIFGVLSCNLKADGRCPDCHRKIPGHFDKSSRTLCFDERV